MIQSSLLTRNVGTDFLKPILFDYIGLFHFKTTKENITEVLTVT